MPLWFRRRIRHPFYPKLFATPAAEAQGRLVALSGTFHELERAAAGGVTAERALFVTTRWNVATLSEAQRDRLWALFQVPVYAMLVDDEARLVGYECEAQNGFHIPGKVEADSPLCECGRAGRLLHAETAQVMPPARGEPAPELGPERSRHASRG
jgi:hypothetical protein